MFNKPARVLVPTSKTHNIQKISINTSKIIYNNNNIDLCNSDCYKIHCNYG